MNYSELLQLARFGVIFCDYQRIIIWRLLWNYKNVCNGFSVFCSPDQEGIYAPEEIRKPVAFFSKMEMQFSPFLSATFGTFIMQETPMDIANMVMFLCSDKTGFITGENICIDGGMTKLMIYHDDHGWTYTPEK